MTKRVKIALGVATFWPIILVLGGQVLVYRLLLDVNKGVPLPIVPIAYYVVPLVYLTGVLAWALLVFYIVHALTTQAVPDNRRRFWVVILLVGNLVAMPVYWYKYVWPEDNGDARHNRSRRAAR